MITTTPGAAAPASGTPSSMDAHELQHAINEMASLAREGLDTIGAVAFFAMRWLETPEADPSCHRNALHAIFRLIRDRAVNYNCLIAEGAKEVDRSSSSPP